MRKNFLLIVCALTVCATFVTNAQVYVDSLGIVQVGNYENDFYHDIESWSKDTSIVLNVKGYGQVFSKKIPADRHQQPWSLLKL